MTESKKIRLHFPTAGNPFTGERYGVRFDSGYAEVDEDNPFLGFLFDMGIVVVDAKAAAPANDAPAAAEVVKSRNKGELLDAAKSLGLTVKKDAKVGEIRELVENAEAAINLAAAEAIAATEAAESPVDPAPAEAPVDPEAAEAGTSGPTEETID